MAVNAIDATAKNSDHPLLRDGENQGMANQDPNNSGQQAGGKSPEAHHGVGHPGKSKDGYSALMQQGRRTQRTWTHNKALGYRDTQGQLAQRTDSDGDMNMAEGSGEANNREQRDTGEKMTAAEWAVVDHHRDRTLAVQVALEDLTGETAKEKLADLMDILLGNKINPPRTPTKVKYEDKLYFRVQLSSQEEMNILLEGVVDNTLNHGPETEEAQDHSYDGASEILDEEEEGQASNTHDEVRQLFQRIDVAAERKHQQARSIELHGIPARVNSELLKLAANQLGDVDKISLRGCARGLKMTATVWYDDQECVDDLKTYNVRYIPVGRDLVRIKRLGEETIQWELNHVCKLHGIPRNTTPVVLKSALDSLEVNADFVEVPKFYWGANNQVRYRQEAFVYFKSAV